MIVVDVDLPGAKLFAAEIAPAVLGFAHHGLIFMNPGAMPLPRTSSGIMLPVPGPVTFARFFWVFRSPLPSPRVITLAVVLRILAPLLAVAQVILARILTPLLR